MQWSDALQRESMDSRESSMESREVQGGAAAPWVARIGGRCRHCREVQPPRRG